MKNIRLLLSLGIVAIAALVAAVSIWDSPFGRILAWGIITGSSVGLVFLWEIAKFFFSLRKDIHKFKMLLLEIQQVMDTPKSRMQQFIDTTQSQMQQFIDTTQSQIKEIGKRHSQSEKSLRRTQNELRYLSDMVCNYGHIPPPEKENALASYIFKHCETHRKAVAFAHAVENSRIRELFLQEIFLGIEQVWLPIGAINELTRHPNKVDMLYVCAIARHTKAQKVFEFGTYKGQTAYHLTFASDDVHVTTLDLPPEADNRYAQYLGNYFRGTEREKFITQLYANSYEFDTTPYRQQFDFIFVDADHSYEAVKNDTQKAFELLRPGGVIVWHDYAPKSEGLVKFFQEFTQQDRPLFRIKRTCLLLHLDGVDPIIFQPHPMPPSLEIERLASRPDLMDELYHV